MSKPPLRYFVVAPDKRKAVLNAMKAYGGSFAQHIADAWLIADSANQMILADAFDHEFRKYERLADYVQETH